MLRWLLIHWPFTCATLVFAGHTAPEAAAGAGGLELVCTGDVVTIDVEGRTMNYVPSKDPNRPTVGYLRVFFLFALAPLKLAQTHGTAC